MARKLLFALSLLIVWSDEECRAQILKDKIFFGYEFSPATDSKRVKGQSEVTHRYELQAGPPPIRLSNRLQWINSFYSRVTEYNLSDLDTELAQASSRLYDLQYGSIFIYDLKNPRWSLFAAPRILYRSDFNDSFSAKGVFFSGTFLANYNPDGNDKLVWSFGVAYANDFNRHVVIPIAGFTYNDHRYLIEVAYPRVNLLYKPRTKIETGTTISIIGGIFNTDQFSPDQSAITSYTRTINVHSGYTFNYLLSPKVVLNTCIGYAFVRNYDFMDSNFERIRSVDLDLNGSLFFRSGMSLRL